MPTLQSNDIQITIATKKTGTGTEDTEKAVESLSKKLQSQSENFKTLGKAAVVMGAAAGGALALSIKAAVDFEDAFAGVLKTSDSLGESVSNLSEDGERFRQFLRNTSKETGATRESLAGIAEIAGQLGVSSVDNLEKFTRTIQDISVSTSLTSEAAATDFARIANVMNEPLDNIDKMGSSVVALGNNFATTEPEILGFANRISAAGSIAGLSTADIFGIGTAFSSVGIQAEAGGTAVQKVLISMKQAASGSTSSVIDNTKAIAKNKDATDSLNISLQKKTNRLNELKSKGKENSATYQNLALDVENLKKKSGGLNGELEALQSTHGKAAVSAGSFSKVLGVTQKQFAEMFEKDPSEVFTKFIEKLKEIEDSGGDAAAVLDGLELSDQRLLTGFLATAQAGDLMRRSIDTANTAFSENTALSEEAAKRYSTTANQMKIFQSNISDIGVTIGSALLPALNQLMTSLAPAIASFASFAEQHPMLITGILGGVAAIGALSGVLMVIMPIVTAFTGILAAFGITVSLSFLPVTAAILALAGLSAAIYIAVTDFELFKSGLITLGGTLLTLTPGMQFLGFAITDAGWASTNAAIAQRDLKAAQDELSGATQNLADLQVAHEQQIWNQEEASRIYEQAVKDLTDAEGKYGVESDEAKDASHRLEGARIRLEQQNINVRDSADKLAEADGKVTEATEKVQDATEKAASAAETANGKWGRLRDVFNGVKDSLGDMLGKAKEALGFGGEGHKAVGGAVFAGQAYEVGERGPELFIPQSAGRIVSNRELERSGGSSNSNGGVTVNIDKFIANSQSDINLFAAELAWRTR